jgi:hypothetical protein
MGWPTGLESENAQLGENLLLRQVQQILLVAKTYSFVQRYAEERIRASGNARLKQEFEGAPYAMAYWWRPAPIASLPAWISSGGG